MYDIEMQEPSLAFARCWREAGLHLDARGEKKLAWLKAQLMPPFLEHLSFRIGNQLFFIRVEDVGGRVQGPGSRRGLLNIARSCNGHACLMPMRRGAGGWTPELSGWGLVDASSSEPIDPPALVSDEPIEMTDWEIHDLGVQIVRQHIGEVLHREIMSWQGNPSVDPSIWFVGSDGPEWVVVRTARFPQKEAPIPANIDEIAARCAMGKRGHFASVSIGDAADDSDPDVCRPLLRGHGIEVDFGGFVPVTGR